MSGPSQAAAHVDFYETPFEYGCPKFLFCPRNGLHARLTKRPMHLETNDASAIRGRNGRKNENFSSSHWEDCQNYKIAIFSSFFPFRSMAFAVLDLVPSFQARRLHVCGV